MKNLILKYNTPTPRYTAYPPANFFSEKFTAEDYLAQVDLSNSEGNPHISLYIHIPFCKNLCYYCGCNSYPEAPQGTIDSYIKALKEEIQMILGRLDSGRRIAQIHYGGGTPNLIAAEELNKLNKFILSFFHTIDRPEIAIECHPALLTPQYILELKRAGFNRFSLGIQDFDQEVLRAVNRLAPKMPIQEIVNQLRGDETDVEVNLDFIYGLPKQTVESFSRTIEQAMEVQPDRLVTFSYAHVPWVNRNQERLKKFGLPELQTKTDMFLAARAILQKNGYQPIGIDHYVLPTDELFIAKQNGALHRNFQGYCTQRTTGQVYAFGVSAISQLHSCYAQNTKSITEYIKIINQHKPATAKGYRLSADELAIRTMLMGVMCNDKIVWHQAATRTGCNIEELKSLLTNEECLDQFIADGIVTKDSQGIYITEKGHLFTRNVASALDPLFERQSGNNFSKTI